jgi:hypothetical protein
MEKQPPGSGIADWGNFLTGHKRYFGAGLCEPEAAESLEVNYVRKIDALANSFLTTLRRRQTNGKQDVRSLIAFNRLARAKALARPPSAGHIYVFGTVA